MRRSTTLAVLTICAGLAAPAAVHAQPAQHVTVPTAEGTGGAAATVDKAATDAAIRVLRQGGNAVDAAVTAAGVLGVVEPYSCGIGGGGFLVIRTPGGKVTTIDGRETAPLAMRPNSFIENGRPLSLRPTRAGAGSRPACRARRRRGTTPSRSTGPGRCGARCGPGSASRARAS